LAVEIDAGRLAEGYWRARIRVPARNAGHRAADLGVELDGVPGDVSETLDAGGRRAGFHAQLLERLAQGVDKTVAGRLDTSQRTAGAEGLARDGPRNTVAVKRLVLVEHPGHVLAGSHHVRRRYVPPRTNGVRDPADPGAADPFDLVSAQPVRIAHHATHAASEGNVHDRRLPGRPHGEGPHRVDGLLWMESNAAPRGSAGVVVLHPESLEDLDLSVVETYRKGQTVLMGRLSKEGARRRVEPHEVGEPIELGLGIGERVEGGDIIHEWIPLLLMIAHCRRELGIRNEELGMQHTHSLRSGGRLGGNS